MNKANSVFTPPPTVGHLSRRNMDEPTYVSNPMMNESESKPDADAIFPVKLHRMLDWAGTAEMSHIESWSSHGRMFRVSDKDAFMEKVLPRFFKSTIFRSFTRQVSIPDPGFFFEECTLYFASAKTISHPSAALRSFTSSCSGDFEGKMR